MPRPCPPSRTTRIAPETIGIDPEQLRPNPFSISLYGDPSAEIDDLIASVREHGILVPSSWRPGRSRGPGRSSPDTADWLARKPWG